MTGLDAVSDSRGRPELPMCLRGMASRAVRLDTTLRLPLLGSRMPGAERHESLSGLEVALGGSHGAAAEVVAERTGRGGHGGFLPVEVGNPRRQIFRAPASPFNRTYIQVYL
jgi:hypothetical protein